PRACAPWPAPRRRSRCRSPTCGGRTSFRSSSHAEWTEIAFEGQPADPHVLHPCHARSGAERVEKSLERGRIALGLHLHRAIAAVANVTVETEPAGLGLGKVAEANALDVADNLRLEAAALLANGQSGVGQRAGPDHDRGARRRM